MFGQEKVQQFLQRHHLGHGLQFAPDAHQIGLRIAHHRHQFLDVDQSDRVIEMTAAERKTRVPRIDRLLHVVLEVFFDIEINNFAARRHDIAHDAAAQIERVNEQVAAERRDFVRLFALIENEAQFLLAVRELVSGAGSSRRSFSEQN